MKNRIGESRCVLVAPLDWGLGHATRCIPVIRILIETGAAVHLAGSSDSLALLRREFPTLPAHDLPSYAPRYPSKGNMVWMMARQLPHFVKTIALEHRVLQSIIDKNNVTLVISDNRYGCWSRQVHSVFITHQSNILMPRRFGWLAPLVRGANKRLVGKFDSCWIPDYPGDHSLAGDLMGFGDSSFHRNVRFVGPLSRFEFRAGSESTFDILAVCSGPEPQRTILETLLRKYLLQSSRSFLLVRGVMEDGSDTILPNGRIINFLTSTRLENEIQNAGIVIARSGYSTVMDLYALGKKAIFIPTPGQTEQEYLARQLHNRGIAVCVRQESFDLETAIQQSRSFSGFRVPYHDSAVLKEAIIEQLALTNEDVYQ